jgi:Fe-S-cluster-containing hydrogenase component 2
VNELYYPLRSLQEGHWFKLICGASYQHLPAIRNLALVYTLAGVDCIDVAADPAVIRTARVGIAAAKELYLNSALRSVDGLPSEQWRPSQRAPWLMVSFNDGEDPHFRKAEFDASRCPADCPRPCDSICPAQAIAPPVAAPDSAPAPGVLADRCYGCGRCVPVCPLGYITTRSHVATPAAIAPLVLESGVDAIEIHTHVGHGADFQRLWQAIVPWVNRLKLVAVSCPDGEGLIDYLRSLHAMMSPLPCALVWQTDGRPMSGDIGTGATRAAVKLGQKVLAAQLPGFVQLAGGTNDHTVAKLRRLDLLNHGQFHLAPPKTGPMRPYIAGVAYGSYARSLLAPVLEQTDRLETVPELLNQGVALARSLVAQLKPSPCPGLPP